MENEKICKIVQDLLPNYIENLTSKETNIFIEGHLNTCSNCKNILENMKNDLNPTSTHKDNREIKYMKKYNNKMRILKIIIFTVILLFVILTVRKIIIISDLYNKAEKTKMASNYHEISYSYNLGYYYKEETFKLDNKKKIIITQLTEDGNVSTTTMFANKISDNNNTSLYSVNIYGNTSERKKTILNKTMEIYDTMQNNPFYTENWWQLLKCTMLASIKPTTFNGSQCYYLSNFKTPYSYNSEGIYANKETGFLIGSIAYEYKNSNKIDDNSPKREPSHEYILELNMVTDSDFIEPNINEYEIQE